MSESLVHWPAAVRLPASFEKRALKSSFSLIFLPLCPEHWTCGSRTRHRVPSGTESVVKVSTGLFPPPFLMIRKTKNC